MTLYSMLRMWWILWATVYVCWNYCLQEDADL